MADQQRPILLEAVPDSRDAVQRLAVPVPGDVGHGGAGDVTWDLKFFPDLSQSLELHLSFKMRLFCNRK